MRKFPMVLVLAILMMAGTAMADTFYTFTQTGSYGTLTAYMTVGTGTATLTFGPGLNSFFTDQVGIHVSNNATNITGSGGSGWTFQSGLNSVNCSGTGNWLCAINSSLQSFNGLSLTWNFTGTLIDPPSLQFAVCRAGTSCAPGTSNFVTNFSQVGSVPEPASLSLLGAGLVGIGGLARRRRKLAKS